MRPASIIIPTRGRLSYLEVALESVAHLLFAGRSTFHMTYDYEMVNGRRVGSPQPRMIASARP